MPVITELLSERDVDVVAEHSDVLQIGTRNMQNFVLLSEAGKTGKPVMLKRGLSATIEEWLLSAEYILTQGNPDVILCERGVRTFETQTRNTLDLNAVALVKRLSHLPVIVDPSHGTGALVPRGSDGDRRPRRRRRWPDDRGAPGPGPRALRRRPQSLTPEHFDELMQEASALGDAVGRPLAERPGVAVQGGAR